FLKSSKNFGRVLALLCMAAVPMAAAAQSTPAAKGSSEASPSRWDIFLGYSYLAPKGTVNTPVNGTTVSANYDAVNVGGLFSGAYYFNKYVGVQAEFGEHQWGDSSGYPNNIGTHGNDDGFYTVGGGIIFRFPAGNITPFVHGLVDAAQVNGPYF